MASTASEFKFGTRSKYDWDTWFDGQVWELKEGEDYDNPVSARAAAYAAGKSRAKQGENITVQVSQKGKSLFVQAVHG